MLSTLVFVAALATVAVAGPRTAPSGPLPANDALLQAELRAWKEAGKPDFVHFPDDNGQPVRASVAGNHNRLHGALGWGWDWSWDFFPSADDISFHLFTKQNDSDVFGHVVELDVASLLDAGFDPKLPTKVVIHGFTNTIESPGIQNVKNAYLGTGSFNVIGVDWGKLCPGPLYFASRAHVPMAGERVGEMLTVLVAGGLVDADNLHVVGHSLGAHVAGLAGKRLLRDTGKRPKRTTGLDPAWPLFFVTPAEERLFKEDADLVDVIHTCAGNLGYSWALGTTDFFPNGGSHQPGCGMDLTGACNHAKSFQYFAQSIADGNGYQAFYCKTDMDAMNSACTSQVEGCMGEKVYFKEAGSYYLTTDENGVTAQCPLPQEEESK